MGMNGHGAFRYIVDIETAPIADAQDFLDMSDVAAPSNYKDQAKIDAYCKAEIEKRVSKAALDLDLCRIVAIGWLREDMDEGQNLVRVAATEEQERADLIAFWDELDERTTIGYNQIGFDLPILLRRSLYLGVTAPSLNLDKYHSSHIDLQQRLSLNGTKPYRSLNWYCRRFKLAVPADDSTGKDIGQLVADGHWEAVAAHCRADVLKTRALAERMGIVQPMTAGAF